MEQVAFGIREGDVLDGKYRIDKILGSGGMGVVVAAHHLRLDDRVAIKFLLPAALANREAVTRFAREAQAAVKIKSEHVARVRDVGTLENGAPYMVMEYLEGSDLAAWLRQRGALAIEQAIELVLQACEAIAEAHALGIVHRDLKPANLFVIRRPDGHFSVKVLDFGISKQTGFGPSAASMTSTAVVMGSPLYMSPEQMRSARAADARSDIWALGVILYELLSGNSPFLADTMPELVLKIVSEPPPPLRNRRPDAPSGIEQVILKCLEKDPGKRYRTVGELAVALVEYGPRRARASVERIAGVMQAAGMSASALALPLSSSEPVSEAMTPGTLASWGQTIPSTRRGLAALLLTVAVVGVLVAVGGYALRAKNSSESDQAAAVADAPAESLGSNPATPAPETVAEHAAPPAPLAVVSATASSARPAASVALPRVAARRVDKRPTAGKAAPAPSSKPAPAPPVKPAAPASTNSKVYDDRK